MTTFLSAHSTTETELADSSLTKRLRGLGVLVFDFLRTIIVTALFDTMFEASIVCSR
jgi:hypothetical protein